MTDRMDSGLAGCSDEQQRLVVVDSGPQMNTSASASVLQQADVCHTPAVPDYLQEVYYWGYLNPRNVSWLDREPIVKAILWWQHNTLRRAAFAEIETGASVLQVAAVYGNFSKDLADHIGLDGNLKLIDVAPIQVKNTKVKMAAHPQAEVHLADASTLKDKSYDIVLSYFLLHEIPDDYKVKVLDNLLNHLKPEGKLVIVDYHKPHWAHPLKPVLSLVFDKLEPFAKTLWRKSFQELASEQEKFTWKQNTYFGGLFQKVVVAHKRQ